MRLEVKQSSIGVRPRKVMPLLLLGGAIFGALTVTNLYLALVGAGIVAAGALLGTKLSTAMRASLPEPYYAMVGIPGLFLLTNKYPYLAIGSVAVVLAIGAAQLLRTGQIINAVRRPLLILTSLYLFVAFSYFVSGQSATNFFSYEFIRWDGSIFFSYALFFAFLSPTIDFKKALSVYATLATVAAAIIALVGLIEYFSGITATVVLASPAGPIFFAFNKAHNATGSAYAAISIIALTRFLTCPQKYRYFHLIIFMLVFAGLLLAKSRGGFLAFAGGAAFIMWLLRQRTGTGKAVFRLTVLIVALGVSIQLLGLEDRYSFSRETLQTDYTTQVRTQQLWPLAWELFRQSPILGVGWGRFNDIQNDTTVRLEPYPGFVALYRENNAVFNDSNAHSSYLNLMAEAGITGLAILLAFWYSVWIRLYHAFTRSKTSETTSHFASCLGVIVTLFILALTENYLTHPTVMMLASAVCSLGLGVAWQDAVK